MLTSKALVRFIQLKIFAAPKFGVTVGCKPCGVWILEQIKGMEKLKSDIHKIGFSLFSNIMRFFFFNSHSQILTTIHPLFSKSAVI